MDANSRAVSSNQRHTHPKLPALVRRHLNHPSRRPVAEHSRASFESLLATIGKNPRPLVLDSFCGTGKSTALLAQRYPDHLVIGVDKSAHRLTRHTPLASSNYRLLQADCEDIWRLLADGGFSVEHHYLLYPNPWPKSRHLQRRIHGSAALPFLLQLGGTIELRSNWQLYLEEFGLAMHLAGHPGRVSMLPPGEPMTLFEAKYQTSGHKLWVYNAVLTARTNSDAEAQLG